jgi:hypothetical protein
MALGIKIIGGLSRSSFDYNLFPAALSLASQSLAGELISDVSAEKSKNVYSKTNKDLSRAFWSRPQ